MEEGILSLGALTKKLLVCLWKTRVGVLTEMSCFVAAGRALAVPGLLDLHSALCSRYWCLGSGGSAVPGTALPLPGCVTLSKSLNLSERQTPHL